MTAILSLVYTFRPLWLHLLITSPSSPTDLQPEFADFQSHSYDDQIVVSVVVSPSFHRQFGGYLLDTEVTRSFA